MGAVSGKPVDPNTTPMKPPATTYDAYDPRSPSLKRTPLANHEQSWRQKAVLAAASKEDPRSPSVINRTPLATPPAHGREEPVTPLTLSYDTCNKINPEDPRSPSSFRTPLAQTQGDGAQYDTTAISIAPLTDDTLIVNNPTTNTSSDLDITLSASSGLINTPLAGMSIMTSTEVQNKAAKQSEETRLLAQSESDVAVPSSPLGASACSVEDEEKPVKSVTEPIAIGDRKRKKAPTLTGTSPLKKSFPSPGMENDENSENSPTAPRRTPTTPRATRSPNKAASPTATKRAKGHARRPSNLKNSTGAPSSPRSPLSPIVPHQSKADVTALAI